MLNPEIGKIIPGSGGVRKLRWKSASNNKGKSGGVRILYHYTKDVLILLVSLYSKSEQGDLSPKERAHLKQILPIMLKQYLEDL